MRFLTLFFCTVFLGRDVLSAQPTSPSEPEALVLIIGDQHSAYERTAQFVGAIDRLKAEYPALPMAILVNGDTFEYGNVVARRSAGVIEFAMFTALAQRAPTILNLGNHEPEFFDLADTVQRIQATGVTVISNISNHATGQLFAPASARVKLGRVEATVVGITTDRLSTYRLAVRPTLDLANPVVWAKQNFPALLDAAPLPIVLSHAGLNADRTILPLVPAGTLFAGAHDHQRFIHPTGRGAYVQAGAWNEYLTLAWLRRDVAGVPRWTVEQIPIVAEGPADATLAELIRETRLSYLTGEDTAIVGHVPTALAPAEAAQWVTRLLAKAVAVDAAFVGNTTFGAGLPAGALARVEFDACVRFDGTICIAEIDGLRLKELLAKANQGADTKFEQRLGEFLIASGPERIDPVKRYRIATTDWGARNSQTYFGLPEIVWQEQPGLKFKARVLEVLEAR